MLELDETEDNDNEGGSEAMQVTRSNAFAPVLGTRHRGAPWYESLVEDTALGRVKRQRGGHSSGDGSYEYEWEVTEWTEGGDDEGDNIPGKRKIGEVEEPEDQDMRA